MKRLAIPLLALTLALGGCAGTAQVAVGVAQHLSSKIPNQAATLADAAIAARLCEDVATAYVQTASPSKATLDELDALIDRVHLTLKNLEAANASGQSLTLAVFNEALGAYRAYAVSKGL